MKVVNFRIVEPTGDKCFCISEKEFWVIRCQGVLFEIAFVLNMYMSCNHFSWQVFHLRDIRWEKPQFLSKSFLGFVTFNIITYSLLLAEFVTTNANTSLEKKVN